MSAKNSEKKPVKKAAIAKPNKSHGKPSPENKKLASKMLVAVAKPKLGAKKAPRKQEYVYDVEQSILPHLTEFRMPATEGELRRLATPTHLIFPNIILIWHPDYLSLITLYPAAPDRLRWVHTMLIPPEKSTPDWSPHWEKTFGLIEKTVFQAEDLFAAEGIQRGLKSGANTHLTVGKLEFSLRWFHQRIARAIAEESAR